MPFAQQVGLFVLTHMISLCSASCVDFVLLYLVTCVSFFAVTTLCGGVVPRYLGLVVVGYISSLCWSAINVHDGFLTDVPVAIHSCVCIICRKRESSAC